jgi:hypothetical protein
MAVCYSVPRSGTTTDVIDKENKLAVMNAGGE